MEPVRGVAPVMGPVLVSRVIVVLESLDPQSELANRVESGADSSQDAFVSIAVKKGISQSALIVKCRRCI